MPGEYGSTEVGSHDPLTCRVVSSTRFFRGVHRLPLAYEETARLGVSTMTPPLAIRPPYCFLLLRPGVVLLLPRPAAIRAPHSLGIGGTGSLVRRPPMGRGSYMLLLVILPMTTCPYSEMLRCLVEGAFNPPGQNILVVTARSESRVSNHITELLFPERDVGLMARLSGGEIGELHETRHLQAAPTLDRLTFSPRHQPGHPCTGGILRKMDDKPEYDKRTS